MPTCPGSLKGAPRDPADLGLYNIRSSINHGTVDVNDQESFLIVKSRFPQLWGLVFGMLDGVIYLNMRSKVQRAREEGST